jgi:hypothetical protein
MSKEESVIGPLIIAFWIFSLVIVGLGGFYAAPYFYSLSCPVKVCPEVEPVECLPNDLAPLPLPDQSSSVSAAPPASEPVTYDGKVVETLLHQAEVLVKDHACWKSDWEGRKAAGKEYVTLLELGKEVQLSYVHDKIFEGFIEFNLKEVGTPLSTEVVSVTVDVADGEVDCDPATFTYDWTQLYEEQDD